MAVGASRRRPNECVVVVATTLRAMMEYRECRGEHNTTENQTSRKRQGSNTLGRRTIMECLVVVVVVVVCFILLLVGSIVRLCGDF